MDSFSSESHFLFILFCTLMPLLFVVLLFLYFQFFFLFNICLVGVQTLPIFLKNGNDIRRASVPSGHHTQNNLIELSASAPVLLAFPLSPLCSLSHPPHTAPAPACRFVVTPSRPCSLPSSVLPSLQALFYSTSDSALAPPTRDEDDGGDFR